MQRSKQKKNDWTAIFPIGDKNNNYILLLIFIESELSQCETNCQTLVIPDNWGTKAKKSLFGKLWLRSETTDLPET